MNEQENQLEDSEVERIKTCKDSHFYLNVGISLCFTNFNKNELNFVYSQIIKHFHEVITYSTNFCNFVLQDPMSLQSITGRLHFD